MIIDHWYCPLCKVETEAKPEDHAGSSGYVGCPKCHMNMSRAWSEFACDECGKRVESRAARGWIRQSLSTAIKGEGVSDWVIGSTFLVHFDAPQCRGVYLRKYAELADS